MHETNRQITDASQNNIEDLRCVAETKTDDLERIFSHIRAVNFEQNAVIVNRKPRYILLSIIEAISLILVPLFLKYAKSSDALLSGASLILAMIFTLIYLGIPIYFFLGGTFDVIEGENFDEISQVERLEFNLKIALNLRREVENNTVSVDKVGLLKTFSAIIKNEIDYVSEASNIYGFLFAAFVSISLAASLITNNPDTTAYKIFSILLAGIASGFVVLVKGRASTRTKKLRRWLLISEMSQNI